MSGNQFWIGGGWEWRRETPGEIGKNVLRSLDHLSGLDPHFSSWRFLDLDFTLDELRYAENPHVDSFALEDVRGRFTEIVEGGVATDDDGTPEPVMGYSVIAMNHGNYADPFSVTLNVDGGGGPEATRRVLFETGSDQVPDPSIVAYPVFKSALLALASIWDLVSARARSKSLSELGDYPALRFDLSWMTYLSAQLAAQITPPAGVAFERIRGGGILLIAAEETFDTANPLHMTAARKIRDALAPLNDLEGHERMKQKILDDDRKLAATGFPGISITGQNILRRQRSRS